MMSILRQAIDLKVARLSKLFRGTRPNRPAFIESGVYIMYASFVLFTTLPGRVEKPDAE
jgi:hypothetical protein